MRTRFRLFPLLGGLAFAVSGVSASSPHTEKGLWIELKENGSPKTVIAMTEGIARQLLESDAAKSGFHEHGKNDLITREILEDVLNGRQESCERRDEDGSEVKAYMKRMDVPEGSGRGDRLVLEVYKSGVQTFRLSLPEVEMESHDEKSGDFAEINIGWKALLPCLAKEGGAIYIADQKDDTEVWFYAED